MIVEIHGAGFVNKGAELMLRTTLRELSERVPGFVPAVCPKDGTYADRAALGLRHILPGPGRSTRFSGLAGGAEFMATRLAKARYRRILTKYGLADESMVDGLVDTSGFAFSDQWGAAAAERFAKLAEAYRRRSKPVVLLPQALGPFEHGTVRSAFRRIAAAADVIYARDGRSYDHAIAASPYPDRVHLAPDMTLFDGVAEGARAANAVPYCCLVPNVRMLDRGDDEWRGTYSDFLATAGRRVLGAGFALRVLLHSLETGDAELAARVADDLGDHAVSIESHDDPYALKEIIGQSHAVIGSRYHSLVAAFSQGVPSLALGWSHKYANLYADFGLEDFCLGHESSAAEFEAKLDELLDHRRATEISALIRSRLASMAESNERMWSTVATILRCRV
jgi:polysaccharide pyruvyl transferase WcaK-like protein